MQNTYNNMTYLQMFYISVCSSPTISVHLEIPKQLRFHFIIKIFQTIVVKNRKLEKLLHYYRSLVIRIINRIMICCLLFVYLNMLLQRFDSLILPNPGVQTLCSVHWIHKICRLHFQSRETIFTNQCHVSVLAAPTRKSGYSEQFGTVM